MKKIIMSLAAVAVAVSASAQKTAVTGNKFGDNWYVGVNAGVATPTTHHSWVSDLTPNFGVRVGKNLTTVFGLALDGNLYGSCACSGKGPDYDTKTFIDAMNISLLGTFNLSNLFCGYKGEPRLFEVSALYGFGWGHRFGTGDVKKNSVTSKVAIDLALNFGAAKQWQFYIEPSLNYGNILMSCSDQAGCYNEGDMAYNINRSNFQLNIGFNYKFGCSNGKHNFAIEQLRDQSEIDALNAKINSLRADLDAAKNADAQKTNKIQELQKALKDCENKPVPVVEQKSANLLPSVWFRCDKYVVDKSQMANVDAIAAYMKNNANANVKILGFASSEGNKEHNQKLSENRANAVMDILVKKHKISADRLSAEGLGATDKLFKEKEFNRVVLFNDVTK